MAILKGTDVLRGALCAGIGYVAVPMSQIAVVVYRANKWTLFQKEPAFFGQILHMQAEKIALVVAMFVLIDSLALRVLKQIGKGMGARGDINVVPEVALARLTASIIGTALLAAHLGFAPTFATAAAVLTVSVLVFNCMKGHALGFSMGAPPLMQHRIA